MDNNLISKLQSSGSALIDGLRKLIPANEFTVLPNPPSMAQEFANRPMQASFSAYNATPGQTDVRPTEMASGKQVYDGAIATGNRSIPLGTRVFVPKLNRTFIVEDRMNKRYDTGEHFFDIYMPDKSKALKFGRQKLDFVILPPK